MLLVVKLITFIKPHATPPKTSFTHVNCVVSKPESIKIYVVTTALEICPYLPPDIYFLSHDFAEHNAHWYFCRV